MKEYQCQKCRGFRGEETKERRFIINKWCECTKPQPPTPKTELQKDGEMVLNIISKMSRKASTEREEKHLSTKEMYERAVHGYCGLFCEIMFDDSTVYDPDYWVAGDIGTIICIADYWFSFSDIKEVVDKNIDRDTVFEWYDYTMEGGRINLYHYAKGLREEKENL